MCKRPLKGFRIGTNPTGKPNYLITSYNVHHLERRNGNWIKCMGEFKSKFVDRYCDEWIEIPCGKCVECRLNYSKQWATRCMLELLDHDPEECWFLTLTYDEEHVHKVVDELSLYTLDKEDLVNFWKRLRWNVNGKRGKAKGLDKNIRYYACGEYGDRTMRPHYHAIVYSTPIDDLVPWCKSATGHMLFRSKWLEDIWQKGIVTVAPVTIESCAYTARYVMKKADGRKAEDYELYGLEPEFTVMSRVPGIAKNYYDEFKDKIYKFDEIILKDGLKCRPPRYFDSKFEADNPDEYLKIKEKRKEVSERNKEMKMSQTDKDYLSMLQAEEKTMVSKLKALRRDNIYAG